MGNKGSVERSPIPEEEGLFFQGNAWEDVIFVKDPDPLYALTEFFGEEFYSPSDYIPLEGYKSPGEKVSPGEEIAAGFSPKSPRERGKSPRVVRREGQYLPSFDSLPEANETFSPLATHGEGVFDRKKEKSLVFFDVREFGSSVLFSLAVAKGVKGKVERPRMLLAEYLCRYIPYLLQEAAEIKDLTPDEFRRIFARVADEVFQEKKLEEEKYVGLAVFTSVLVGPTKIIAANLGDSAVIFRISDKKGAKLLKPHDEGNDGEIERLEKITGERKSYAFTRAFGHVDISKGIPVAPRTIIPEPTVLSLNKKDYSFFVILSGDAHNYVQNEYFAEVNFEGAGEILKQKLFTGMKKGQIGAMRVDLEKSGPTPENSTEAMLARAAQLLKEAEKKMQIVDRILIMKDIDSSQWENARSNLKLSLRDYESAERLAKEIGKGVERQDILRLEMLVEKIKKVKREISTSYPILLEKEGNKLAEEYMETRISSQKAFNDYVKFAEETLDRHERIMIKKGDKSVGKELAETKQYIKSEQFLFNVSELEQKVVEEFSRVDEYRKLLEDYNRDYVLLKKLVGEEKVAAVFGETYSQIQKDKMSIDSLPGKLSATKKKIKDRYEILREQVNK